MDPVDDVHLGLDPETGRYQHDDIPNPTMEFPTASAGPSRPGWVSGSWCSKTTTVPRGRPGGRSNWPTGAPPGHPARIARAAQADAVPSRSLRPMTRGTRTRPGPARPRPPARRSSTSGRWCPGREVSATEGPHQEEQERRRRRIRPRGSCAPTGCRGNGPGRRGRPRPGWPMRTRAPGWPGPIGPRREREVG